MRDNWKDIGRDIVLILAGTVVMALGLDLFLVPNRIAAGGVSGLATVLHYTLHLPVGAVMLALNVPIFIWGFWRLGWGVGFRSVLGTVVLSLAVDSLAPVVSALTHDTLLASLYGGVVVGLGLALVYRGRGSTGGTALMAVILRSYTGVNVGQLLFLVDGAVVATAGIAFRSAELAMYALLSLFVSSWVIDLIQEGISDAKAFLIISDKHAAIAQAVLQDLDRGVTLWEGRGGYTGKARTLLLAVVSRSEVPRLKETVYRIDPRAFIILADVHEVIGEGFKELDKKIY
ncbi:YitT family protein [Ammonifex thiophilus]|uniref:YitT family protein n=1 Tax=Ammonifex thiophilus TaxID=444093 RepID=A0A3D8P3U9_9THEO|nr:YitT family protein [Ammonifex thiophilus]RDV82124.1 YitT family protein [Ammonifex thiophilus]